MRPADTYRSERRNLWRHMRAMPWEMFNPHPRGRSDPWHIGSFTPIRATMKRRSEGRSKYMPHNGKREMARRLRRAS